jgi:hypothetical protein
MDGLHLQLTRALLHSQLSLHLHLRTTIMAKLGAFWQSMSATGTEPGSARPLSLTGLTAPFRSSLFFLSFGQCSLCCILRNLLVTGSALLGLPLQSGLCIHIHFLLGLLPLNFTASSSSRSADH